MLTSVTQSNERLNRQLLSVKTDQNPADTKNYFEEIIAERLGEAGVNTFGLLLHSREERTHLQELPPGYFSESVLFVPLIQRMNEVNSSNFTFRNEECVIVGYTENQQDWVVLKYESSDEEFFQDIVSSFWCPFFDFA